MANSHGTPIWYELLTPDANASKAFYESVIGWTVQAPPPGARDYRMIDAGDGVVGGVMQLTEEMKQHGARPTWLFYVAVDDVDASLRQVTEAGGNILLPAFDLPGVGRLAMIADPQGIPLYVMRETGAASTAFQRTGMGRCNWNELATPDQPAAHEFYAKVFGWTYPDKMSMPGELGDYVFVAVGDTRFGATMKQPPGEPAGWQFYFRAADIDVAAEKVKQGGGQVHAGPMEVPGGERVIVASDPQGVRFGVAAAAK